MKFGVLAKSAKAKYNGKAGETAYMSTVPSIGELSQDTQNAHPHFFSGKRVIEDLHFFLSHKETSFHFCTYYFLSHESLQNYIFFSKCQSHLIPKSTGGGGEIFRHYCFFEP